MTDAREFRNALGRYATGVTIVTTRTPDGEPWGVTVNSFSSVSLEPRLVLWSLAKKSYSLEAFQKTGSFVIHILASDQERVSNRFARGAAEAILRLIRSSRFGATHRRHARCRHGSTHETERSLGSADRWRASGGISIRAAGRRRPW